MHSLSIIAVEADDETGARAEVESFLEQYQDHVWDWYTIGGRWDGLAAGKNSICAGQNRHAFLSLLDRGQEMIDHEFNELRQNVIGPDPRVPVSHHGFFAPNFEEGSAEHDQYLERVWSGYRSSADEIQAILHSTEPPTGETFSMVGYHLRRLGDLLSGMFSTGSYLYDSVAQRSGSYAVRERIAENPDRQWLVVVDMHH
jgi:hypothetical protein